MYRLVVITSKEFGTDREAARLALEAENIESRPVWKSMHLQPVFEGEEKTGNTRKAGQAREGRKVKKRKRRYRLFVTGYEQDGKDGSGLFV